MSDNTPDELLASQKKPLSVGGCWVKLLLGVCVLIAAIVTVFLIFKLISDAKIDRELELTKATGTPITADELAAFYTVPDGYFDATPALRLAVDALNSPKYRTAAAPFPIVGNGGSDVPAAGEKWTLDAQATAFLRKYAEPLNQLHTLRPHSRIAARFQRNFSAGIQMDLGNIGPLRDCGRLLALQAHVRARSGDLNAAAESIVAIRRLSDSIANEPILISSLVSIALDGIAVDLYQDLASQFGEDAQALETLATSCNDRIYQDRFRAALIGERMGGLQAFDTTPAAMRVFMPDDKVFYLQYMREVIALAELPIHEAIPKARELTEDATLELQKPSSRKVVSALVLPAMDSFAVATGRAHALASAMKISVAAQRYRLANKTFPSSIEQLVDEYLPSVPLDPFDGKPMRCISRNQSMLVYSVGEDVKDDGGKGPIAPDISVKIGAETVAGSATSGSGTKPE